MLRCLETFMTQLRKEGDDMPYEFESLLDDQGDQLESARITSYTEALISFFKRTDYPVFIILDALDEAGDAEPFDAFVALLEKVQNECSPLKVRILVSTRPSPSVMEALNLRLSAKIIKTAPDVDAISSSLMVMINEGLSTRFDADTLRYIHQALLERSEGV